MCTVASPARLLLAYTRTPTVREEANNADIALSLHLAMQSPVSGQWEPLNENYGIFFAKGESKPNKKSTPTNPWRIPGVDVQLACLKEPFVGRLHDGTFAILAVRCARGGIADGSEKDSVLLATSADLLSFTFHGMLRLPLDRSGSAGIHHPRMQVDGTSYRLTWEDDNGQAYCLHCADLDQESVSKAVCTKIAKIDEIPGFPADDLSVRSIPDVVPSCVIEISAAEAQKLVTRYGRPSNTSVTVPNITLPASLFADLRSMNLDAHRTIVKALQSCQARLSYSDGSHGSLAIRWQETAGEVASRLQAAERSQTSGHDSDSAASVTIHGRIRQTRYPVPFAVQRADPSVYAWKWNGKQVFLFIATEDENGNCIDPACGAHMPLRMADSVLGLSDAHGGRAHETDLLQAGDRNSNGKVMTGCFWAPEFHMIGGRLSILFMPCFDGPAMDVNTGRPNPRAGKPDMWTGCCHIMQLKKNADGTDPDPRNPASWSVPEPITRADGSILNPIQHISLDMTYFEDSGSSYYAWQQVGSVWIARVDPHHPAVLASDPVQIIVPEFSWDNTIAEGPYVITHNGMLFLIYSGSLVGIDYTTGLAMAPAGKHADLCDPSAWTKLDYPLQKSGIYNGAWQLGTGHGMFSHDEDGNLLYVFHAANNQGGIYHGRDAQVRRVHWAADGLPILDMQENEEVAPALRTVTTHVKIG